MNHRIFVASCEFHSFGFKTPCILVAVLHDEELFRMKKPEVKRMSFLSNVTTLSLAGIAAAVMLLLSPVQYTGSAQAASCYDLWYERNSIFARNGHCFKTRKARSVFGAGCFPPYGRLGGYDQQRVDSIKRQERAQGCGPGGTGGYAPPAGGYAPPPPAGGGYANMSCGDLWYARNAIYARNGHCFKTRRGRNAFGAGCFPPYGRLGGGDQRQINDIQYWERRNGCR